MTNYDVKSIKENLNRKLRICKSLLECEKRKKKKNARAINIHRKQIAQYQAELERLQDMQS